MENRVQISKNLSITVRIIPDYDPIVKWGNTEIKQSETLYGSCESGIQSKKSGNLEKIDIF